MDNVIPISKALYRTNGVDDVIVDGLEVVENFVLVKIRSN